jgi:hypothetical protein
MKEYVINESGETVGYLEKRNDEIKDKLESARAILYAEQQRDKTGRKKLGFRMGLQLLTTFRSYGLMSADNFTRLDYQDIWDYSLKFNEIIAYYNLYFEIVPTKELFWAFMGIDGRMFEQLLDNQDEDIKKIARMINGDVAGLGWVAGESGNANDKAIKTRLSASGEHGHGIVSASEDKIIQAVSKKTPFELQKELQGLIGGDNK